MSDGQAIDVSWSMRSPFGMTCLTYTYRVRGGSGVQS
jgi:hypothetical protein